MLQSVTELLGEAGGKFAACRGLRLGDGEWRYEKGKCSLSRTTEEVS